MPALGDPSLLDDLAARYDRAAEQVASTTGDLVTASGQANWQCQAADRFRGDVGASRSAGSMLADTMRSLAQQLRGTAEQTRQEIASLRALESQVRQVIATFSAAGSQGQPPWYGSQWHPGNLPSSTDPAWRSVARSFGV